MFINWDVEGYAWSISISNSLHPGLEADDDNDDTPDDDDDLLPDDDNDETPDDDDNDKTPCNDDLLVDEDNDEAPSDDSECYLKYTYSLCSRDMFTFTRDRPL